jgi:hypothetical protein
MVKTYAWLTPFIALQLFLFAAFAAAQPPDAADGAALRPGALVLVPGAVTGIGTSGPVWYWRLCSPGSIGLGKWRVSFLEKLLKPTAEQTKLLAGLARASTEAANAIAAACPKEVIATGPTHLRVMERRVNGLLRALQIIRPAYETFYAALDGRQKSLVDALGPGRRGWRW